jgi:glyceraldehyde-3-phosphate dehydrogenase/erythrose-4-phosphate dehydrogenase
MCRRRIAPAPEKGSNHKVLAWYDNEWAYSARVAGMAALMATKS